MYGCFFPGDLAMSYSINRLFMTELPYLESSLHIILVATYMSGKPQASFQIVKNKRCLKSISLFITVQLVQYFTNKLWISLWLPAAQFMGVMAAENDTALKLKS